MEEIMTNSESASCQSVESLDLRNNCIGPGGAKAVAQWIKQHKELKEVYLSWNSLGNEGLYHIVQALGSKCVRHREARIDVSYGGYDRVSRVKCFQAIDSAQSEKCTEDGDETDWDEMDEKLKKMVMPCCNLTSLVVSHASVSLLQGIKTKDFGFPPRGLIGYPEA
eukprot:764835-Hanusia_phi.AAC.2